jgi:hypothetical protein
MVKTLRDIAWERIESLAAGLVQKSAEPLTREQAVAKVLETPEGKEAYTWYVHPYANLPATQALEKLGRDAVLKEHGVSSMGEAVAKCAEAFCPGDPAAGLAEVRKRLPWLYELYERESR